MLNFRSLFIDQKLMGEARQKDEWSVDLIEDVGLVYNNETDYYLLVTFKNGRELDLDLSQEETTWSMNGVIIPGYIGTYYVVDCIVREEKIYYLLEHEEYGDETACLIVDNYNKVIDDEVYDEWLTHLEEAFC